MGREYFFLKVFNKPMKREPNFGGQKYCFVQKFHTPRESTGASLTYGDQALSSSLVLQMSNKEDFKDFEAMTEKANFSPSKLVTFQSEYNLQRLYFDKRTTAAA